MTETKPKINKITYTLISTPKHALIAPACSENNEKFVIDFNDEYIMLGNMHN